MLSFRRNGSGPLDSVWRAIIRVAQFFGSPRVRSQGGNIEKNKSNGVQVCGRAESFGNGGDSHSRSLRHRVAVCARRDGREGEGLNHVLIGDPDGLAMATFQGFLLALQAAAVDRAD